MFGNTQDNSNQACPNPSNSPFNFGFNSYSANPSVNRRQDGSSNHLYQRGFNAHHDLASNQGSTPLNLQSNQMKGQFPNHSQDQTNFQIHGTNDQFRVSNDWQHTNGPNNGAAPGYNQCLNGEKGYNFSMNTYCNDGGQQQGFNLSNQNNMGLSQNNGKYDYSILEFNPDATWLKKNDDYIFIPEISSELNDYVWVSLQQQCNLISQELIPSQIDEIVMQKQYSEKWPRELKNESVSQQYFSFPPSTQNWSNILGGFKYLDNVKQTETGNICNHKTELRQEQNSGWRQGQMDEFNRKSSREKQGQEKNNDIWNNQSYRRVANNQFSLFTVNQNRKKCKRIADWYNNLHCKRTKMRARAHADSRNKRKIIKKRILSNNSIKNKCHSLRSNKFKSKIGQHSAPSLNPNAQNTIGGNYSSHSLQNCQFPVQSNNGQFNGNTTYGNNNFGLYNPGYGFTANNYSGQSYLNSGDNSNVWPSSNYSLGSFNVGHNIENQMMNTNNVPTNNNGNSPYYQNNIISPVYPGYQPHNSFGHTINYGFQDNNTVNHSFQSNSSFNNAINAGPQNNNSWSNNIQPQTQNNFENQMNGVNMCNNNTSGSIANQSGFIDNRSGYIDNLSGYIDNPSKYNYNSSDHINQISGCMANTPQNTSMDRAIVCAPNRDSYPGNGSQQNWMKAQEERNNEMEQEYNIYDNVYRNQSNIDQLNSHSMDEEFCQNPLHEDQLIMTPKFPDMENQSSYELLNILEQSQAPKPNHQNISENNSKLILKSSQGHLSLAQTKGSSNSSVPEQGHRNGEQSNHRYFLKKQNNIYQSESNQLNMDSMKRVNDQISSNMARSPNNQHCSQWLNIKDIVETLTEYEKPDLADFIVEPPWSILNNLTMQEIKNLDGVTIENQFGKITFLDPVSLYKKKLGECIKISQDWVQILDGEWEGKHCEILFKSFANYNDNNNKEKRMIRSTMKDWVKSNRMILKEFDQTTGDLTVRLQIRFDCNP